MVSRITPAREPGGDPRVLRTTVLIGENRSIAAGVRAEPRVALADSDRRRPRPAREFFFSASRKKIVARKKFLPYHSARKENVALVLLVVAPAITREKKSGRVCR